MPKTVVGLVLLLLSACGTTAGVAEFRVYTQAIDATAEASAPIIDRLSVVERANAVSLIDNGNDDDGTLKGSVVNNADAGIPDRGLAQNFAVAHAAYFAQTGRPPFAGSIELSIAALQRFNGAMTLYADGKALDAALADFVAIGRNAELAATALGISVASAVPATSVAAEGISALGGIGSRSAFRDLLKSEGKTVDDLLAALIDKAPLVFQYLSTPDFDERALHRRGEPGFEKATTAITNTRALIAEWVLLLQAARQALASALLAIDDPGTLGTGIADAALITSEIRTRMDRIRAILAESS